jgi:hypothetical protein
MSVTPSLPSVELAAALAEEGRRVLMGHWVNASVEPLQRSLETLRQLELAGEWGPAAHRLAVEALSWLNLALDASGRFVAAADARSELQRRLGGLTDTLTSAMALWSIGCAGQLRGDVGAMLSVGERASTLMQEQDALPAAAAHHALMGWALVMDGEADEGLDELHASAVQRRRHGSAVDLPWLMATCAEARLAAGVLEAAARDLESAHAALAGGATGFMRGLAWRVRGNLRWAAGEGLAAARADWEQALSADRAAGAPLCELQTLLVLGRALAASGEKAQAREGLREVLARLDSSCCGDEPCPLLDIARRQLSAWG